VKSGAHAEGPPVVAAELWVRWSVRRRWVRKVSLQLQVNRCGCVRVVPLAVSHMELAILGAADLWVEREAIESKLSPQAQKKGRQAAVMVGGLEAQGGWAEADAVERPAVLGCRCVLVVALEAGVCAWASMAWE